ncbi:hypothetical protein HK098_007841 [Nowakowskiella sp. JEL0407]|nr:hypothetical protein HK098_007841 [Nowakowskiella sp. JEL0407]
MNPGCTCAQYGLDRDNAPFTVDFLVALPTEVSHNERPLNASTVQIKRKIFAFDSLDPERNYYVKMGILPVSSGDAVYELSSLLLGNYVLLYGHHQAGKSTSIYVCQDEVLKKGEVDAVIIMLANVDKDSEDTFFKSLFHKLECALNAMFGYKQSNTHLDDNWKRRFMDLFRKTNQCTKDLVLMVESTGMLLSNRNVALQLLQTI